MKCFKNFQKKIISLPTVKAASTKVQPEFPIKASDDLADLLNTIDHGLGQHLPTDYRLYAIIYSSLINSGIPEHIAKVLIRQIEIKS